jgi:hypothetical protein
VTKRQWLGLVALFFAWGFVIHGAGLLLHEVGGHGVAVTLLGCGMGGIDLTYFGHGVVHFADCETWTWARLAIVDWAGLVVTIAAGIAALAASRRPAYAPMTRFLLALLGTSFLLQQLAYATSGGFHDLYDPGRTACALARHGLHALAWVPALVLFAVAAIVGARTTVEALREELASRSRLHALRQIASTVGVAGLVYFVAFRIEWQIRTDIWMRGVAVEARRLAIVNHEAPPFPIEDVIAAIAVVAFVAALARPVRTPGDGVPVAIPKRIPRVVAAAAVLCFLLITLLVRV